jgi:hypothetical protein
MDPADQLTFSLVYLAGDLLAFTDPQSIDDRATIHARAVIPFDQQWNAAAPFDVPRPGKRLVKTAKLLEQHLRFFDR